MKRIPAIITIATFIFAAGCSSTKNTTSVPDDVYYAAGDRSGVPQPASAVTPTTSADYSQDNSNYNPDQNTNYGQTNTENQSQAPSSSEQYTDEKGNTYVTNNYYDEDDYYDYQYSARLKRFYAPAVGYGYYDPFYTNSYWYDYNPYNYGVSIYLGYNWWAPSFCYYDPFWYAPVNPYFHNHYGYYDSWYSPYGYYGYNNYWNGYNHGYNDGYWNGYYNGVYASTYNNPYYYNSYDGNSTYYGPRGSISSNGKTTTPSPRATLGEKYQHAVIEHTIPTLDPHGVSGTQVNPTTGGGRKNPTTGLVEGTGKSEVSPIHRKEEITGGKNPVQTEPVRNPISVKNETGGKVEITDKPKVDPTSYSTPGKTNTVGINQNPKDNGGSVRPTLEQPVRSTDIDYTRPKNKDVTVNPRDNRGGTARPQFEQPRNIQPVRPHVNEPRNNDNFNNPRNEQPRNNNSDRINIGQPRNENINPQNNNPRVEPRNEQPRSNPSFERPRQEIVPRIEQRQEPRQYKQEISQPRQKESISTPAPRQQNISEPGPRKQNSNNENKGSGRRK